MATCALLFSTGAHPYVRRRNRPARTRSRNCIDFSVAEAGFGFGFALAVAVCFAAFPQREPYQLLGRQILRHIVDRLSRRGDAFVVGKHGSAAISAFDSPILSSFRVPCSELPA